MRTSGFEAAFHQRDVAQTFQNGIVCDRRLPLVAFGKNSHLHTVTRVSADIAFDPSFVIAYDAPYECTVFTLGRLMEKLHAQMRLCFRLFGDNQQAGRIFIDTMDESQGRIIGIVGRIVFQIPGKGIHQRAGIVSVSGMHDQPCRFVDHQQIVIFVHDFYRNIFRENLESPWRPCHHNCHDILRLHPVIAFHRFAVRHNTTGIGSRLYPVTRSTEHPVYQKFIHTQQRLPAIGHEAEVFIQLRSLIFTLFRL